MKVYTVATAAVYEHAYTELATVSLKEAEDHFAKSVASDWHDTVLLYVWEDGERTILGQG